MTTEERLHVLLSRAAAEPARPVDLSAVAGRVRRRRQRAAAAAAALACAAVAVTVAVAGGGRADAPVPVPAASSPTSSRQPAPVSDASVLIGSWRVEAAGEEPGAVLRIDGDFALQRRCGELGGVWAAVGDQFVALMFHADAACAPGTGTEFTPRWVARLQRFTMDGGRPILLDGAGAVVARLTPLEGAPADEAVRAAWRRENLPAAPLPAGLTPATRERVLGRWLPVEDPRPVRREQAYVLFAADGSWTGSDGCNGEGGQWALGERGVFAAASGPSTKIGCSNAALGMGFGVHRAAFAGGDLVLLNRKGKELARFRQG